MAEGAMVEMAVSQEHVEESLLDQDIRRILEMEYRSWRLLVEGD